MAPSKWDEEEQSTPPSSPPIIARRGKFDDEEEDSDVLDTWEEAEDSEVEREKAKKAAEAKAKAEAEAKATHMTKSQRIEARRQENLRKRQEEDDESEEEEDEATRRAKQRAQEQAADLQHAEDLFGGIQVTNNRKSEKPVVALDDPSDPTKAIDLSALSLFRPSTKDQFGQLRETLVPLITANARKAQYTLFLQEFTKQLCKDLPSDQIRKIASSLTTLTNEKMKEEKQAEKGSKKSKAAKTKTSLVANRDMSFKADTNVYDDFGDDDFM